MQDYNCPDSDQIILEQETFASDGNEIVDQEFLFVVNSCQSMKDNGLTDEDCLDPTDYLDSITAQVELIYEFFDPQQYQEDQTSPFAYAKQ